MPVSFLMLGSKQVLLVPSFDIYIDLPSERKGIDASRSYEAVAEVFNLLVKKTFKLEDLCAAMANELLKRHEYATRAEVKARSEAIYERTTPKSSIRTFEPYKVYAKAVSKLSKGRVETSRAVGVKVVGITACPCVAESVRELFKNELAKASSLKETDLKIVESLPLATHMQRSEGFLMMDSPPVHDVDVLKLIDIVEGAMSSPTYELLKREDELELVLKAVDRPRFIEDSIRLMAEGVVQTFKDLPDETRIFLAQHSEESVHKHDLITMLKTTLGELRAELAMYSEG